MEDWFPPLGLYPLKDEVGMGVVCVTLRLALIKGRYIGHPKWDSMRKVPRAWANIYVAGVLVMGDKIYSKDGKSSLKPHAPRGDHGL